MANHDAEASRLKSNDASLEALQSPESNVSMDSLVTVLSALSVEVRRVQAHLLTVDQRLDAVSTLPRPQPAPPFSLGGSHTPPLLTAPPGFSTVFASTVASPTSVAATSLPASSPQLVPSSLPALQQLLYGPSTTALVHDSPSIFAQPLSSDHYGLPRLAERTLISRPQTVDPLSCWGPPHLRQPGLTHTSDPYQPRIRVDPPRFDGTNTNHWLRNINYYFDHLGTPHPDRLHYVLPLFDPPAADWVWNYCQSHTSISWFEFLDDVRRRFDPNCYQNYRGLLSKLTQTGTVADYQTTFEALQNNVTGFPSLCCWTCLSRG